MFRVNLKETICIINRIYDVYHSGTYPLGHLCSSDTSIWGDTIFGPRKMLTYSLYLFPLVKGHLYSWNRVSFSILDPQTRIQSPSGYTLTLRR